MDTRKRKKQAKREPVVTPRQDLPVPKRGLPFSKELSSYGTAVLFLIVLFIGSFTYIFDVKVDMNGDNCVYYRLATSLAEGHGYSDPNADYAPTTIFPPGYPILMSPLRFLTDSIVAQKILNGLFLLISVLLIFVMLVRHAKQPVALVTVAVAAMLLNYQLLRFSTMMMSEMSFLLFSVLTCLFIVKIDRDVPLLRNPYFYLSVFSAAYCYHIRTQGIALFAAIVAYYLFSKRWKPLFAFVAGYGVCLLPWMIRNKVHGLEQSRYLDVITSVNTWRPDEGKLDIWGVISRFFDTFSMLLAKAIPNTVPPYFDVDYGSPIGWGWLAAVVILALMGVGMWKLGRLGLLFSLYTVASLGVISIFSAPSENRYITTITPFCIAALIVGLYNVLDMLVRKSGLVSRPITPWLLLPVLLFSFPFLETTHQRNKADYPPAYQNYIVIAKEVHKRLPPSTVVCSRKAEFFQMYSKGAVCGYSWTPDKEELIGGLIRSKADYVVLEQLGFSSTPRYLYPAIQSYPALFTLVMHLSEPDTYLFKFDREQAKKTIQFAEEAQ
jgi:hypothetical protein